MKKEDETVFEYVECWRECVCVYVQMLKICQNSLRSKKKRSKNSNEHNTVQWKHTFRNLEIGMEITERAEENNGINSDKKKQPAEVREERKSTNSNSDNHWRQNIYVIDKRLRDGHKYKDTHKIHKANEIEDVHASKAYTLWRIVACLRELAFMYMCI